MRFVLWFAHCFSLPRSTLPVNSGNIQRIYYATLLTNKHFVLTPNATNCDRVRTRDFSSFYNSIHCDFMSVTRYLSISRTHFKTTIKVYNSPFNCKYQRMSVIIPRYINTLWSLFKSVIKGGGLADYYQRVLVGDLIRTNY